MKRRDKFLLILITFLIFTGCFREKLEPETVKNFNVEKFSGQWHEIGRITNKFEEGLVGVTATYTLKENGELKVLNKGYKDNLNGKLQAIEGKAKIPNPDVPSKLKVYFFPFFGSEFNIISIKGDYKHALIGGASPDFLWILSRYTKMDKKTYNEFLQIAKKEGYNINKVEKVLQLKPKKEKNIEILDEE